MAQAITREYKEISLTFNKNPITNDLIVVKNATSIARSVRNLILTIVGERFFQPDLGSRINNSLFELLDFASAAEIQSEIELTIKNYEPRVEIQTIEVDPAYDDNGYNVLLSYFIVGEANIPQTLQFILQPSR